MLCKHEDLSSNPQAHVKAESVIPMSLQDKMETRALLEACELGSLRNAASNKKEDPVSNKVEGKEQHRRLISDLQRHIQVQTLSSSL